MKKFLAILLSVLLFSSTIPLGAVSVTAEWSGDFRYEVADGEATILRYSGEATELTIPDTIDGYPVIAIDGQAFYYTDLTSITLPAGIQSLHTSAFDWSTFLTAIHVDEGNAHFSSVDGVLFDKGGATLVRCPEGRSGEYSVPDGTLTIGDDAFYRCGLTSVTLPDGLLAIGDSAFGECYDLSALHIPDSVTSIGEGAFVWCDSLSSLTIPAGVTSIGSIGQCGCLSRIDVDEDNPNYSSVDGVLFNKDKTVLMQYPAGKQDATFIIPDSVTEIANAAFFECNLTSITIPEGVTAIPANAFVMSDLVTVYLPASLTFVGYSAFCDCGSITDVYYAGSEEDRNHIQFEDVERSLLDATWHYNYVPESEVLTGTTGDCTWTLVDGHLTISGNGAMADYGLWQQPWPCGSVTSITIDEGVTAIGEYAFYRCTKLQTIVIPDSVLSIGGDAFGACYNLASVIIGNGVTSIGIRSFELCYNLSSVTFGDSVTTIGKWAFLDCDNLTSVVVPDSVTTINDEAFSYCDSLTTVTLGRGVAHIGDAVFAACLSLKNVSVDIYNPHFCSVDDVLFSKDQTTLIQYPIGKTNTAYVIPDGVTTIGAAAFGGCTYLTSVDIPNSVTVIGEEAFQECENLAVVTIPDSVIIIDEYAFALCYSITSLTLGNSVTTIGESAFTFANITALTIPDSVTSIGTYAFAFTAIDTLYLGKGVQTIGEYAFASEVAVLTDVYYTGSEDDRSTIDIDDGNDILLNATWHYNYGNEPISGTTADGWRYEIADGEATILGYGGGATDLVIPSTVEGYPVTAIGDEAFYQHITITSVVIPDGVTTIGSEAFADCIRLTSVTIPHSVTAIGSWLFGWRDGQFVEIYYDGYRTDRDAMDVNVGNGILLDARWHYTPCPGEDHVYAFPCDEWCNRCEQVRTPEAAHDGDVSCTVCGKTFLEYAIADGEVTITNSSNELRGHYVIPDTIEGYPVTAIDEYAFYSRVYLTSITIPDGVTSIGGNAFELCHFLTSVEMPDSITCIDRRAFYDCTSLTDVYYTGSEADRDLIDIVDDTILNATWHYNYSPVCTHVYDDDADPDCNLCGVARWVVNPDGDVVVSGKDSGVTLPAGTVVSVEQVAAGSVTPDLSALGNPDAELITVYDITLTVDGESIQPGGVVSVTLPIPADAGAYTDLQVVYVDSLGNVTLCETIVNGDGTITFFTDHFSYYAIVGVASATPGDANGDGRINNKDLGLLQQYLNDWTVTIDIDAMDVNKDGRINNKDLGMIQQYLNDWDVTLG